MLKLTIKIRNINTSTLKIRWRRSLGYFVLSTIKISYLDLIRALFLIYENHKYVFMVTITDKKAQQREIDLIKTNLDIYKEELEDILKKI